MGSADGMREELEALGARLREAPPADKDALAHLGAALEALSGQAEGVPPQLASLLEATLGVLQAVYLGEVADAAGALGAAADAVEEAARWLAAGEPRPVDVLEEARARLAAFATADGGPGSEGGTDVEVGSLDDVLGMLVGLDGEERDEFERLASALGRLTEGLCESARERAEAARGLLERLAAGECEDAGGVLQEACAALEEAVRLEEEQELSRAEDGMEEPPGAGSEGAREAAGPSPAEAQDGAREPAGRAPDQDASPQEVEASAPLPPDTDLDLLREFIVESLDHIAAAEAALLELEGDPEASEPLNVVFRAFHTIKGTSGFLALEHIQRLAHLAENLLDRAREGEIRLRGGYADLALESCDTLKALLGELEGAEPGAALALPEGYAALLERLGDPEGHGVGEEGAEEEVPRVGDILVAEGKVEREAVEVAACDQGGSRIGETLVKFGAASAQDVAQALRTQRRLRGAAEGTVRVSTERLDALINMVGELVISHSMIAQDPEVLGGRNPRLAKNVTHAGKIVRELQDITMALRMVPLRTTFQKMARLVRDLARKSGKQVQLLTEGEETEIDRNMVEALNDPLVHMMRNAVDHGIESGEERRAAGKPEVGTVWLRAYHSAGNVVIEIEDDGRGLDRERIVAKAVERGLVEAGRELSDEEAFALIFEPGFSTAKEVTDISGRGVGMDVVRKSIEGLRGRVEVASRPGRGSTFTIRLPLTMAITDAMLVRVGAERYLLPTVSIQQSFRPEPGSVSTVTGRGEVVMLRGSLLPVVRLHELFEIPDAVTDPYEALLIAVEAEGKRCAFLVDDLLGQQQVVIKSLGEGLGRVPGIAGGAILGDGRVGLILDPGGVVKLAQQGGAPAAARRAAG